MLRLYRQLIAAIIQIIRLAATCGGQPHCTFQLRNRHANKLNIAAIYPPSAQSPGRNYQACAAISYYAYVNGHPILWRTLPGIVRRGSAMIASLPSFILPPIKSS